MGNKKYNQQDLDRFLSESNVSGRGGYGNSSQYDQPGEYGTWVTSDEQFDELYKSVDNLEKYLRS